MPGAPSRWPGPGPEPARRQGEARCAAHSRPEAGIPSLPLQRLSATLRGLGPWLRTEAGARVVLMVGLLGLAWLAGYQAWGGLPAQSFWLDDLWVATLVKHGDPATWLALHPPSPLGFLALCKALMALLGPGHLAMQLVAFVARPLAVVVLGAATYRLTRSAGLGVAAGALLAAYRELAEHTLRAKQFTLDVLVVAVLLYLIVGALQRPTWGRVMGLGLVALLSLLGSLTAAFVGPPAFAGTWAWALWPRRREPGLGRWVAPGLALLGGMLAVGVGLFLPQANPHIVGYWWGGYLPWYDAPAAWAFLARQGQWFLSAPFPHYRMAWLLLPGLLLAWRELRPFSWMAGLFYLQALVLSALRLYPMYTGRVNLYAAPILLATGALGALALLRRLPGATAGVGLAAWLFAAVGMVGQPVTYSYEGERETVELAARLLGEEDGLVASSTGGFALGFYGPWPVRLERVPRQMMAYLPVVQRPRTVILDETSLTPYSEQLRPLLEARPRRVVYVGSHTGRHNSIVARVARGGYTLRRWERRHAAVLAVLERDPALSPEGAAR